MIIKLACNKMVNIYSHNIPLKHLIQILKRLKEQISLNKIEMVI